jgi:hypothetical protein
VTHPRLHIVRTFNWGLLLLNDRGATDLPEGATTAPDFATATRSAIAANVRHAQDVDIDDKPAEVTIDVYLASAPEGTVDFRADLDVISGTLEIGDAEATEELEIGPGTWTLALNATPADHPDNIQLWIKRHR